MEYVVLMVGTVMASSLGMALLVRVLVRTIQAPRDRPALDRLAL